MPNGAIYRDMKSRDRKPLTSSRPLIPIRWWLAFLQKRHALLGITRISAKGEFADVRGGLRARQVASVSAGHAVEQLPLKGSTIASSPSSSHCGVRMFAVREIGQMSPYRGQAIPHAG
jgi:hypothetical protein